MSVILSRMLWWWCCLAFHHADLCGRASCSLNAAPRRRCGRADRTRRRSPCRCAAGWGMASCPGHSARGHAAHRRAPLSVAEDWDDGHSQSMTLVALPRCAGHDLTLSSIANSLKYASLATLLDLLLGIAVADVVVRTKIKGRQLLRRAGHAAAGRAGTGHGLWRPRHVARRAALPWAHAGGIR